MKALTIEQMLDTVRWAEATIFRAPVPDVVYERGACRQYPHVDPFKPSHTAWMRAICDGCPVKPTCLAYAANEPNLEGTWAGTTYEERVAMRTPDGKRAALRRYGQIKLTVTQSDEADRVTWAGHVQGVRAIATGKEIRARRVDRGDMLESLWSQCEGIPTARALIEDEMQRPEVRDVPKPPVVKAPRKVRTPSTAEGRVLARERGRKLTNAEKQALYRQRQKRQAAQIAGFTPVAIVPGELGWAQVQPKD